MMHTHDAELCMPQELFVTQAYNSNKAKTVRKPLFMTHRKSTKEVGTRISDMITCPNICYLADCGQPSLFQLHDDLDALSIVLHDRMAAGGEHGWRAWR